MVNIALIGRATARCSVASAGAVAAVVFVAVQSPVSMAGVFFGLVALLTALSAETRLQALNSSARMSGTMKLIGHDPEMGDAAKQQPGDVTALFFGLGLIVLGAAGTILVTTL